ncbi:MAG: hypothetical protein KDD53_02615 [Bdellovibrionales bacterium]|nr:hypothetical protein [Bdellovibrionales bacterium]
MGRLGLRSYIRFGETRPQREYQLLEQARSLGVNAPEPLVYIFTRGLLYQGWLVTREIPEVVSLSELSSLDESRARKALKACLEQIFLLIRAGIFHVDLHPGNVAVDLENRVFLLDFDKAREFKGAKNRLRDAYLHRWRRAVLKHNLPDYLSEIVCLGLRQSCEDCVDNAHASA